MPFYSKENALPLPLKMKPLAMLGVIVPRNLVAFRASKKNPTSTLLDVTGRTDTKLALCLKKGQSILFIDKMLPANKNYCLRCV